MHVQSIINTINVFIAYFFLIIIGTSFMIKPLVKKKDIFTRFLLYLVVGNFYVINIVFILAYLHIFTRLFLIISLVVTIVFVRIMLDRKDAKRIFSESKETVQRLFHGEYGKKLFLYRKLSKARFRIKAICKELFQGKKLEWLIFLAIMCYNIYYYGYNSVTFVSYQAPDEEVHLYWIQSLISGHIFPSGVYPHGFHNILGAIAVFFGFHAVTVVRSFGVISMVIIMTMLYFGLRKILRSKYAALFGFIAYSLLNIYWVESIYRYQFAVPQEYGMIMLMPMSIFLFNYLKDKKTSDLIYFGMCFSMTISIHFYVTIIALVLCLSIAMVYIYRIIKSRLLLKLIVCGILSSVIAIAPLGAALGMGYKMEQSMSWATSVIQGKEYGDTKEQSSTEGTKKSFNYNSFLVEAKHDITQYVFSDFKVLYIFLALLTFIIIYSIVLLIAKRNNEANLYQLSFAVYGMLLIFLILCKSLNLPTVMEPKRVGIFLAYVTAMYMAMPFEILYKIFSKGKLSKICSAFTFTAIPVFLFLVLKYDLVRPYPPFYHFQTKGAMLVDCDIMKKYRDFTWTVVSPVNDTSVILNNGRHYELSDFIVKQENWNKNMEIKIPTKYVFVYIEKRPITLYGYYFYRNDEAIVNRDLVTYEDALKPLDMNNTNNVNYVRYRNILMSKAYYWAEQYKKYFPKEMTVYYEDDELIVYRIVQNEYALNNFTIDYGANERK